MLIADWFVVKLRVWHDCFSLGSEANQHLIVAGTHVRVSLVRGNKFSLRKPKRPDQCHFLPGSLQFLPGRVSTLVSWHLLLSSSYSFPPWNKNLRFKVFRMTFSLSWIFIITMGITIITTIITWPSPCPGSRCARPTRSQRGASS